MQPLNRQTLDILKKEYPKGCRVKLVQMDDDQAPPIGTKGTVKGIDSTGSILVSWDTGSSLNVLYGIDSCEVIPACETICYGQRQVWVIRQDAIDFFKEGMENSDGSEKERYTNVFLDLICGKYKCTDSK